MRDVKSNKKGFYKYMNTRRKTRENVGPQLNGLRALVTQDMEKVEVLTALFTTAFTSKISLQKSKALETRGESLVEGRFTF